MHAHSYASDGDTDFDAMIEKHYELNYDVLAMTDHGTVDRGWTTPNVVPGLFWALGVFTQGNLPPVITGLTEARWQQISTGSDRGGQKMLRVPFGIEQNPTSFNNAHVCSWFVDYGNGLLGGTSDYDTPIREINKRGGLCVINHPGEYTGMKDVDDPAAAYGEGEEYYIAKYANLLVQYPALLGIDVNSKTDGRTHNDRKLWDLLLQRVVPTGRNVFGLATSDAHQLNIVDSGWIWAMMPANTAENLKSSLAAGAFVAGSHYIKNSKELAILEEETGLELGTTWQADLEKAEPMLTGVAVDQDEDTITLQAQDALSIHWVADGEVIATGATIDLDDYSGKIGRYVRAELWGEGGVLYTQPFVVDYAGALHTEAPHFFDWGNVVRAFADALLFIVEHVEPLRSIWGWLTNAY
jgi:hypothetical protein